MSPAGFLQQDLGGGRWFQDQKVLSFGEVWRHPWWCHQGNLGKKEGEALALFDFRICNCQSVLQLSQRFGIFFGGPSCHLPLCWCGLIQVHWPSRGARCHVGCWKIEFDLAGPCSLMVNDLYQKNCQVEKVVNFGFLKRWLSDFSCDFPTSRECQAHMHACCKPIASKINPSFIARLLWPKLGSTMRWWRIPTLQMTMFRPAVHLIQKFWWYIVVYKLINLYIYIYIYISIYISVYISIYLYVFVYLSTVCIYRSIYLSSIYIYLYLSVYLSIYLCIYLSIYLYLSLSLSLSLSSWKCPSSDMDWHAGLGPDRRKCAPGPSILCPV